MADNLTQVLSNYIIYVDSSSLMHGNMEFFKISLFNVLKSTNRKIKVVDFVVKDLKKKQFSDSEKFAVKALKIIEYYRRAGLVEDVVTSGIEEGKILDVIYNNRLVDKDDVCVITENKDLANEIVTSLSARKGIDFDYKIAAVRLINGPAVWNIQTVKPRVMPIKREEPKKAGVSFDSIKSVSFDTEDNDRTSFGRGTSNIDEVTIDKIPEIDSDNDYEERTYDTPSYNRPAPARSYGSQSSSYGSKKVTPQRVEPVRETPKRVDSYHREPVKQEPLTQEPLRQEAPRTEPERVEPKTFSPVNHSRVKRSKLVVSLIVDNSSSLDDQRSALMKQSLNDFCMKIKNSEAGRDLDLAVYGFDGFSPRVIKGYDGEIDINRFDNGGIQVLGKTIELAMDELVERVKLYKSHNIETHKPWLIVMSDGGAYGDLQEQVNKLKTIIKGKKITYFPFCLSSYELDPSLEPLAKLKMFLKIRDNKFTELFNFLYNTLYQRITTPEDVQMRLDKKALAGFIAR